jgi:D-serine deaminase-like pyridoxal phosphate-dependent protein
MLDVQARLDRYRSAFDGVDGPFAFVDLDALWTNSSNMLARAAGKPIRIASKSLRCRPLTRTILDREPGYQGILAFTLPEALWLAEHGFADVLVAYPSTDRAALRALAALTAEDPAGAPVVMVDDVEHLDLIDAAIGPAAAPVRVCLDFDASLWLAGERVRIGPKRSPIHGPEQARRFAEEIDRRPGVRLVGMMSYEGQIAGQGDRIAGRRIRSALIGRLQETSYRELRERRAEAVAAVSEVAALEFVNAGGTGDLERVASEPAMTEATAGSGFYAPTLFDNYSSFRLEPAAMFALPVARRPSSGVVTALGGGYLASGVGGKDRMPAPYLPQGLTLDPFEGTGEVQTPLRGPAADGLRIGDSVFFRHAKAGELCERFNILHLVLGDEIVDQVPTYRGEGRCFL